MNISPNITEISDLELKRLFTENDATSASNTTTDCLRHWGGMINPLAQESLLPDFFSQAEHLEYFALFLGTPYEKLLKYSPYLFSLPSILHPFLKRLTASEPNWGFLWAGAAPFDLCRRHWQSLLNAVLPSGKITHFRFYSSKVMLRQVRACSDMELAWLLGPCSQLFIPVINESVPDNSHNQTSWVQVNNPFLKTKSPGTLAENHIIQNKTWWQVTEVHLAAFKDTLARVHLDNIEQNIWENYPELTAELAQQYGSVRQFIEVSLGDARYCGFNKPEHEYKFIMLCLHYDFNTSPSEKAREALALAQHDPAASLLQLENVLRSPQHGRN